MPALRAIRPLAPVVVVALAACHAERVGAPAPSSPAAEPIGLVPVFARPLDEPVLVLFEAALDPASCTRDTVQITGLDGPGAGTTPKGTLRVTALGDGSFVNAVVRFTPSLRVLAGEGSVPDGLFPDTTYSVRLPAGGLRSANGVALANDAEFTFRTRAGATNAALYGNGRPGAPALAVRDFAPRVDGDRLAIGTVLDTPSVVTLRFDQPIDTTILALPYDSTAISPGFASLVYDDPVLGFHRVIPSRVELVANDVDGGELALRPEGLLPNAATVRVVLRGELRDPSGESRDYVDAAAFVVRTEDALRPRGDFAKADFAALSSNDFVEPVAVVEDGALRAADAFPRDVEGGIVGDWSPTQTVTDFDTDEQTIVYEDGRRRTFVGGVFRVRNLRVPEGHVVRGRGSNPLVFVVEGDAIVDGEISVRGGDARTSMMPSYRGPHDTTPGLSQVLRQHSGGIGVCGGGDGADDGMHDGQFPASDGIHGKAPDGSPTGGGPGLWSEFGSSCFGGSGGGGGSMSTTGDPGYWLARPPGATAFIQRNGTGGSGCTYDRFAVRSLPGGAPGVPVFVDARVDNDFHGDSYDPRRGVRVRGEMQTLRGGSGGGSGGDCGDVSFSFLGGPGGAGGGVLVLKARGRVVVGPRGRLDANGGNGRPGFENGGGGGAGGAIVVMAGERIELHAHGDTFLERDADFCIQCDGGISVTGGSPESIPSKYEIPSAAVYDRIARGGFGGLGLIQLMAPMGTVNDDGTNTVLDDSIDVIHNGIALQGTQKMRYLAWRGLGTEQGTFVDDYGNPTGFAWGEGDMRPSPVLMPVPYGPRSRARSEWIPLGAADRRAMTQHDGAARAVVVENGIAVGPDFAHATREDGWLAYEVVGDRAALQGAFVDGIEARVIAVDANATWNGRAVLAVQLDSPVLGSAIGRFAGYEAELQDESGASLHRLRVLSHEGTRAWLERPDAEAGGIARLRLRHGLARIRLDDAPTRRGLDGQLHPLANARIGFAFHRDPASARSAGVDPDRLPPTVGTFVHDLGDPSLQQQIRSFGARAVQWDVLFDRQWRPSPFDARPVLDPSLDLALDGLWLPFRF